MLPQRGQRSQPPSGPLPLAPKQRLSRPPPPRQRRKTATKGATKPAAAHPPWREIINEIHHRASPSSLSQPTHLTVVQEATTGAENARTGLSRSALRKYAEEQYKLNTNAHISKLNRAIAHSVDKGDFVQPKGASIYPSAFTFLLRLCAGAAGKLKLAPKRPKSDEACVHLFSIVPE
ncbi:hypothetical protein R3P38DRAFT_2573197 [Favolaschia claudopus]|uniref:Histone H1 n=1 Tax=Favolaschia claudopus TaxID=2862362 RepID=A0AAV9ZNL6_9AGAR